MNKSLLILLGLSLAWATAGFSQKFGYCNSVALLSELPEVKQADSDLKTLQTQLTKQGEQKVKELQTKAQELERKKEQGTISPKDYEAQMAKLQEQEEEIKSFEQKMYADLAAKREELYKPILDRVNAALKAVSEEGKFTMVFDLNAQVLLYFDESLDVTALVKAKLQQ